MNSPPPPSPSSSSSSAAHASIQSIHVLKLSNHDEQPPPESDLSSSSSSSVEITLSTPTDSQSIVPNSTFTFSDIDTDKDKDNATANAISTVTTRISTLNILATSFESSALVLRTSSPPPTPAASVSSSPSIYQTPSSAKSTPLSPSHPTPSDRFHNTSPSPAQPPPAAQELVSKPSIAATTPQATPTKTPNVYINGLPPYFPEDQLYALTRPYGEVRSVRSFTRRVGERCSGYGFVLFDSVEEAERCIEALRRYRNLHPSFSKQTHKIPGTTSYTLTPSVGGGDLVPSRHSNFGSLSGSELDFSESRSTVDSSAIDRTSFKARMETLADLTSTNLYFEGLPLSISEPTLAALVHPHMIKSSRFFQTKLSHPPRIIAFVRLETRKAAEEIVERLNGRVVRGWNERGAEGEGGRISVRFADTAEQRELRRNERMAREGDASPARLTIAQAALLNLHGKDLSLPTRQFTLPPTSTPASAQPYLYPGRTHAEDDELHLHTVPPRMSQVGVQGFTPSERLIIQAHSQSGGVGLGVGVGVGEDLPFQFQQQLQIQHQQQQQQKQQQAHFIPSTTNARIRDDGFRLGLGPYLDQPQQLQQQAQLSRYPQSAPLQQSQLARQQSISYQQQYQQLQKLEQEHDQEHAHAHEQPHELGQDHRLATTRPMPVPTSVTTPLSLTTKSPLWSGKRGSFSGRNNCQQPAAQLQQHLQQQQQQQQQQLQQLQLQLQLQRQQHLSFQRHQPLSLEPRARDVHFAPETDIVSPALTYTSSASSALRTPSTLSPATPFFGTFAQAQVHVQGHGQRAESFDGVGTGFGGGVGMGRGAYAKKVRAGTQ